MFGRSLALGGTHDESAAKGCPLCRNPGANLDHYRDYPNGDDADQHRVLDHGGAVFILAKPPKQFDHHIPRPSIPSSSGVAIAFGQRLRSNRLRFLAVPVGAPPRIRATTLESQTIPRIQYVFTSRLRTDTQTRRAWQTCWRSPTENSSNIYSLRRNLT